MEPPGRISSNAIRNETLKVLQSVRPFSEHTAVKDVIRGQYTSSTIKATNMQDTGRKRGLTRIPAPETFVALQTICR
jgi:glucose-6-phosphate 1-dehydrogenase